MKAGARRDVVGRSALWGGSERASGDVYECGGEEGRGLAHSKLRNLGSLLAFGHVVYSQLVEAARAGDLEGCKRWFEENDADVEGGVGVDGPEGHTGSTALAHAASGGSCEIVELLLSKGADVRKPEVRDAATCC